MHKKIDELLNQIEKFASESEKEIDEFKIKLLSKKGLIGKLFNQFKDVPNEQKKKLGKKLMI